MNLPTEQAVALWLSNNAYFNNTVILCGQSDYEIPNDKTIIFVACENTDTPAASLYLASVRIILSSPAVMDESFQTHTTLANSLRTALRNASGIADCFQSTNIKCVGGVLNKWADSQDNQRWLSEANITLGLVDLLA